MEVENNIESNDNEWLIWSTISIIFSFLLANYYVMGISYLIDKLELNQIFKTLNMVLATPGFMLGSVLIIAIITGKTSSLLNVVKLRNWRYYYIPEGIGLQMLLFIPLAIITFATLNLINKLKPIFPNQVKFLTETSQAVQTFALTSGWTAFAILAISAVIVAPIIEEIIFRGVVFSCLKKYINTPAAAIGTSLFFAAFHFNFIQFIPLFLLGMMFQLLFIYHKSIFPCMIYHAVNNSFAMIMLLLMKLKIVEMSY